MLWKDCLRHYHLSHFHHFTRLAQCLQLSLLSKKNIFFLFFAHIFLILQTQTFTHHRFHSTHFYRSTFCSYSHSIFILSYIFNIQFSFLENFFFNREFSDSVFSSSIYSFDRSFIEKYWCFLCTHKKQWGIECVYNVTCASRRNS